MFKEILVEIPWSEVKYAESTYLVFMLSRARSIGVV